MRTFRASNSSIVYASFAAVRSSCIRTVSSSLDSLYSSIISSIVAIHCTCRFREKDDRAARKDSPIYSSLSQPSNDAGGT